MNTQCDRTSRRLHPQRGFTLLEIMVVIVILGVLASLVVPNLMSNKERADRQKALSDIAALENALDMYKLDNNRYPTTEQGLMALVKAPTVAPLPRYYNPAGYLRRLPADPWGQPYQLMSPGEKNPIDIFSGGPDGVAGTDDDIGNWHLSLNHEEQP
ncbi:type II secretion system major pseudopilin GspG [Serratia sp. AKBS12]|uniref:type II secretion system major pseudopilin GspG n=1 Tax=Serratia sp. AKBS12 TaxID=2974597 RepID=UPI0021657D3E|nr:type II secretion system major pseudopilin GspG [Serratia sp. AKBS12]MCS3409175.1 type II secretion system major pseudopilin GspG [Serratia sp. AKBS12]HEI8865500.1 type II secretion system major pseudopilin GspG [Serratia odorifera]